MTLSPGFRLGPYEILSPLCAGGWGKLSGRQGTNERRGQLRSGWIRLWCASAPDVTGANIPACGVLMRRLVACGLTVQTVPGSNSGIRHPRD
jgi:hypothetical protein